MLFLKSLYHVISENDTFEITNGNKTYSSCSEFLAKTSDTVGANNTVGSTNNSHKINWLAIYISVPIVVVMIIVTIIVFVIMAKRP